MQLKHIIESPCGIRHSLDQLQLQSGFTRRWLMEKHMMTSSTDIQACYDVIRRFGNYLEHTDASRVNTLMFKLQALKDIRTTTTHLAHKACLDDIELFEVKHLAILATDIAKLLLGTDVETVVDIPTDDMNHVVDLLDPDGLKIATFYIYDSYCSDLRDLRTRMRKNADQQDELLLQAEELEESVRRDLSDKLHPYAAAIERAQIALADIDLNLAKALQMKDMHLCYPTPSLDGTSHYRDLFHPQVKDAVEQQGRAYQPVDVDFGQRPTLITGANMGGKTVVLKALTLCQYLFQFGMGIPAREATIDVKDEIYFCIGDDQSVEKGLSSFAAEMKHIDAVIQASRRNGRLLAIIDEPARTTNPTEGAALVSALLQVLDQEHVSLMLTTHYDISAHGAHCLRVKGLENGAMNYQLVEVLNGEAPHEALMIARSLGIDQQWIDTAAALLQDNTIAKPSLNHKP